MEIRETFVLFVLFQQMSNMLKIISNHDIFTPLNMSQTYDRLHFSNDTVMTHRCIKINQPQNDKILIT